jgi:hypothetical protein
MQTDESATAIRSYAVQLGGEVFIGHARILAD